VGVKYFRWTPKACGNVNGMLPTSLTYTVVIVISNLKSRVNSSDCLCIHGKPLRCTCTGLQIAANEVVD
jgi:hypothetical protein